MRSMSSSTVGIPGSVVVTFQCLFTQQVLCLRLHAIAAQHPFKVFTIPEPDAHLGVKPRELLNLATLEPDQLLP